MNRKQFLIIGGAAAGMTAATRIRRNCPDASVTVIERGAHISYAACVLPYHVSGDIPDINKLILHTPEDIFEKYHIRVLTKHYAERIQTRPRTVEVRDTRRDRIIDLSYDRLIIATGANAAIPDLPGNKLPGVHVLRNVEDAINLRTSVTGTGKKAVIVGSGYLGLEMAEALRRNGTDVFIIEAKPGILDSFEPEIITAVRNELLQHGCRIQESVTLSRINGTAEGVHSVELDNGVDVQTDMVVFATGVTPNVSLAKNARMACGKSGAIRVNNKQETSLHGIYAIGDCAETRDMVTGKYIFSPQATSALKQARVAADNACGRFSRFEGIAGTAVVKVFNLQVARTGIDINTAQKLGMNADTVLVNTTSKAAYFPGSEPLITKIIFKKPDGRLLGAQMTGSESVTRGIDVCATAIQNKMTVFDMLHLDLAYTPPLAPAWSPVLLCAMQAVKKLDRR